MAVQEEYSDDVRLLIASLKNPRYATETGNETQGPIVFDGTLQGFPTKFTANENDPHQYGADVWRNAHDGLYGTIGPWVPPPPPAPNPYPPVTKEGPLGPGESLPEMRERLTALEQTVARIEAGNGKGNGSRRRAAP